VRWAVAAKYLHRVDKDKPSDRENVHSLIICLLDKSALILWTTGNENFPSVISSAKPLVEEYLKGRNCSEALVRRQKGAHLSASKVHVVVPNLKVDPD